MQKKNNKQTNKLFAIFQRAPPWKVSVSCMLPLCLYNLVKSVGFVGGEVMTSPNAPSDHITHTLSPAPSPHNPTTHSVVCSLINPPHTPPSRSHSECPDLSKEWVNSIWNISIWNCSVVGWADKHVELWGCVEGSVAGVCGCVWLFRLGIVVCGGTPSGRPGSRLTPFSHNKAAEQRQSILPLSTPRTLTLHHVLIADLFRRESEQASARGSLQVYLASQQPLNNTAKYNLLLTLGGGLTPSAKCCTTQTSLRIKFKCVCFFRH